MPSVSELFPMGGPFMWPLAIVSLLLVGFLFERAVMASSKRWREDESQWTIHRRHLPIFIEVAPALGLLGTMQGIIQCFMIGSGHSPSHNALEGLGVACITTLYGLIIALVAQVSSYILDVLGQVKSAKP